MYGRIETSFMVVVLIIEIKLPELGKLVDGFRSFT